MTTIEIKGEEVIEGTIKDFERMMDVDYPTAAGVLKFLEKSGNATKIDSKRNSSGKGKPSAVWRIPKNFLVNVDEKAIAKIDPEEEPAA